MNVFDLIKLIDISWEERCCMLNIYPDEDKGYIHFRNQVYRKAIKLLGIYKDESEIKTSVC